MPNTKSQKKPARTKIWEHTIHCKDFKIVRNTYAISADGVTLLAVNPDYIGVYKVPNTVKDIMHSCFKGCKLITRVELSNKLRFIFHKAFPSDFYKVAYKITRHKHAFLGMVTELSPKTIILKDKEFERTWLREAMPFKIPIKAKQYIEMKCGWGINIQFLKKTLVDKNGFEYSADGKTLLKASTTDSVIQICDGVENIEADAFKASSPDHLIVPASINKVGTWAFHLISLQTIRFRGLIKEFDNYSFGWGKNIEKIFVPAGAKEYYAKLLPDYSELIVEW